MFTGIIYGSHEKTDTDDKNLHGNQCCQLGKLTKTQQRILVSTNQFEQENSNTTLKVNQICQIGNTAINVLAKTEGIKK